MSRNLIKLEPYFPQNDRAARIILADVAKYGGEGALLLQFARRVLEKPAAAGWRADATRRGVLECSRCRKYCRATRAARPARTSVTLSAMRRRPADWLVVQCAPLPEAAARKAE